MGNSQHGDADYNGIGDPVYNTKQYPYPYLIGESARQSFSSSNVGGKNSASKYSRNKESCKQINSWKDAAQTQHSNPSRLSKMSK